MKINIPIVKFYNFILRFSLQTNISGYPISSVCSSPSTRIVFRRLPSLSVCTAAVNFSQSSVIPLAFSIESDNVAVLDSSFRSVSRLPLLNDLRSPSSEAIFFSSFAFSSRSVFSDSIASNIGKMDGCSETSPSVGQACADGT